MNTLHGNFSASPPLYFGTVIINHNESLTGPLILASTAANPLASPRLGAVPVQTRYKGQKNTREDGNALGGVKKNYKKKQEIVEGFLTD